MIDPSLLHCGSSLAQFNLHIVSRQIGIVATLGTQANSAVRVLRSGQIFQLSKVYHRVGKIKLHILIFTRVVYNRAHFNPHDYLTCKNWKFDFYLCFVIQLNLPI